LLAPQQDGFSGSYTNSAFTLAADTIFVIPVTFATPESFNVGPGGNPALPIYDAFGTATIATPGRYLITISGSSSLSQNGLAIGLSLDAASLLPPILTQPLGAYFSQNFIFNLGANQLLQLVVTNNGAAIVSPITITAYFAAVLLT
jgi:hypothetical protein